MEDNQKNLKHGEEFYFVHWSRISPGNAQIRIRMSDTVTSWPGICMRRQLGGEKAEEGLDRNQLRFLSGQPKSVPKLHGGSTEICIYPNIYSCSIAQLISGSLVSYHLLLIDMAAELRVLINSIKFMTVEWWMILINFYCSDSSYW